MGDDKLRVIAAELITMVRKSVTIDWTLREGARAKIGSLAAAARSACGPCIAPPVSVALLLRLGLTPSHKPKSMPTPSLANSACLSKSSSSVEK